MSSSMLYVVDQLTNTTRNTELNTNQLITESSIGNWLENNSLLDLKNLNETATMNYNNFSNNNLVLTQNNINSNKYFDNMRLRVEEIEKKVYHSLYELFIH